MTFAAFAALHGLLIGDLVAGDKIRRCPTEAHPRSDNGAYFYDGRRGWVMAWDGEARTVWWNEPTATPWTEAEKRAWAAKKRAEDARRQEGYRRAAQQAQALIGRCKLSTHHYLRAKHLPDALGLVNDDNDLFVPMRHLDSNALQGGQVIRWSVAERRWDKKMLPGMRAKGAVLRLGSRHSGETVLVEGYATGLSVEAALRRLSLPASVLVCFSDSNLVQVAPQVPGRKYVFADHDASGAGQRAAQQTGLPYCLSDQLGEDANDLHQRAGLMAVCTKLMEVRRM